MFRNKQEILDILVLMYQLFLERENTVQPAKAKVYGDDFEEVCEKYNLRYNPNTDILETDDLKRDANDLDVDEYRLVELLGVAEKYVRPVTIDGFLVGTPIFVECTVMPNRVVNLQAEHDADMELLWSVIEREYSLLPMISVQSGGLDVNSVYM